MPDINSKAVACQEEEVVSLKKFKEGIKGYVDASLDGFKS